MVEIEYAEFKRKYKFLWLRYITGVDLKKHCARCFKGSYEERVKWGMKNLRNLQLKDSRYYYLCGVAASGRWIENLHVAFMPSEGEVIEIDNEFIRCRINNAVRLSITDRDIDYSLPQSKKKEFATCRNWQFANKIARDPKLYNNIYRPIMFGPEAFE